jgi:hypothetical protein
LFSGGWFWEFFSPGLPVVLSALFAAMPWFAPDTVARYATAVAGGVVPVLPFLIWHGVLPVWVRTGTAVALALWPGQVLFCGAVAQDNWVLLPAVGLASVAVRSALVHRSRPLTAALLYPACVAFRQEMLVAMFPLFVAAIWPERRRMWRPVATVVVTLLALAAYRYATTGRFALSSDHAGWSILGSYVPGSTVNGWTDPSPFIASVEPALLEDRHAVLTHATGLAVREAIRRPVFHMFRIASSVVSAASGGEAANLYWTLLAPEVLPAPLHARAAAFAARAGPVLDFELAAIQALFIAAVLIAIGRRNRAVLVLAAAVVLKYAIHAVTVAQGRYFLTATALEILAIGVAVLEVTAITRKTIATALSIGAVLAVMALTVARPLAAAVQSWDVDPQRTYRFALKTVDGDAALTCVVNRGKVVSLNPTVSVAIAPFHRDPAPGETATAVCDVTGSGSPRSLFLRMLDSYAPGGLPDRIVQSVEIDDVPAFSHDLAAEPGSGWAEVPLGVAGQGIKKQVRIEVRAIRPDPGAAWGDAAQTTLQLSRE